MIVVDTSVLVYAVGSEHPLRDPSRRLIDAVEHGRVDATTTPEVIQEFAHVRARRRGRRETASLAREFVDLLEPLLTTETEHLRDALALFARHETLDAFDAMLAATAVSVEAEALVSADLGFASVPRLRHVVPGTREFNELVAVA